MGKRIAFSSLAAALVFFSSPLFLPPSFLSILAITSNCVITDIGNPASKASPPSECAGSSNNAANNASMGASGGIWPFPQKDPTQFKRIDEGWDLQFDKATPIYAIAPGTISKGGPDTSEGGFGPSYPLETLDTPINGFKMLYYGHVLLDQSVVGKHVNTGEVIANSDPSGAAGGGFPNWLEVGYWTDGVGPAAKPHYSGGESQTPEGQQTKQWLLNQNPSGSTNTDTNTTSNTSTNTSL